MASVIFILNGVQTKILCSIYDKMIVIVNKFIMKSKIDATKAQFLYAGNQINYNLTFYEQANNMDKLRNEMCILVYYNNSYISVNEGIIKSKEIICPKCKENCLISFDDYKIRLYDCKNGHMTDNIILNEFDNLQNINENEIKCKNCNNTKYKTYNKQFYKCFNCKINLCPLCAQNHDKKHELLDYNNINYMCLNHKDFYVSYCQDCKINLCMKCESKHNNYHRIIIDKFKEIITELINILNNVSLNIEKYYKIIFNLLKDYDSRKRNYEILKNINSIKDFINNKDIEFIINADKNYRFQFDNIIDIYHKINIKEIRLKKPISSTNSINVIFAYQGNNIVVQCQAEDTFAETALKFTKEVGININEYNFYYNSYQIKNDCNSTLSYLNIKNFSSFNVVSKNVIGG